MKPTYNDIVESYYNGNFTQMKEQFFRLRKDDRLSFCTFIEHSETIHEGDQIAILGFLLRKMIDR